MMKIVKYLDKKKGHRWSIRSRNGKVIADSAEAYTSAAMRDKGLAALTVAMSRAEFKVVDETPAPKKEAGKKPAPKEVKKPKKVKVPAKTAATEAHTLQ